MVSVSLVGWDGALWHIFGTLHHAGVRQDPTSCLEKNIIYSRVQKLQLVQLGLDFACENNGVCISKHGNELLYCSWIQRLYLHMLKYIHYILTTLKLYSFYLSGYFYN